MNRNVKVSEYLFDKYLEWVKMQHEAKTTAEFAAAIGINRQTINKLMEKGSDNIPRSKTIIALSKVIGDDIYDFLGVTKAKTELDVLKATWANLPEEARLMVMEVVSQYEKK